MPNIEIKAKCRNLEKVNRIVQQIKTDYIGVLHQIDTYYETKQGRLKLREINDQEAQLIPYQKDYSTGPMKSNYSVLPVADKGNLKNILSSILGEIAIVDKQREVYLIDNVRVHLDQVKGLGSFLELEAVYTENTTQDREREERKVEELIKALELNQNDFLDRSYVDYLLDTKTSMIGNNLKVLYYFSGQTHCLIEIKNLLAEETDPAEKKFFWFLYDKSLKSLKKLNFKSSSHDEAFNIRAFEDIKVKFNDVNAFIDSQKLKIELTKTHAMFIDDDLRMSLREYFNN